MRIIVSNFCRENFFKNIENVSIDADTVVRQVMIDFKNAKKGYRDGILLVSINASGFFCPVVQLKDGMILTGRFCKRMETEESRKKIGAPNIPMTPARYCDVVLYSKEVLLETRENTPLPGMEFADWEIITLLPRLDKEQPMPVDTLLYNHFEQSGGTKTNMTNDEFVEELKKSFLYWKDKAMVWDERFKI